MSLPRARARSRRAVLRGLGVALTLPWLGAVWPAVRMDAWPPTRWPRAALRLALQVVASALLEVALLWGSLKNRRLVL